MTGVCESHHPECIGPEDQWIIVSVALRRVRVGGADIDRATFYRWISGGRLASRNPGKRMTRVCPGCVAALAEHGLSNAA